MNFTGEFLHINKQIQRFISNLNKGSFDSKIEELGEIKTLYAMLKKKVISFAPEINDLTIVDERSNEIYYAKKFYLDYMRVINKMLSRFDEKYNTLIEEFN